MVQYRLARIAILVILKEPNFPIDSHLDMDLVSFIPLIYILLFQISSDEPNPI